MTQGFVSARRGASQGLEPAVRENGHLIAGHIWLWRESDTERLPDLAVKIQEGEVSLEVDLVAELGAGPARED